MPDDEPPAPLRSNGAVTGPVDPRLVTYDARELRETLDLLGTVVASLSDRVDGQTATLDKLTKTAAETRAAAFHAKSQMDMKPVADAISQTLEKTITPLSRELIGLKQDIHADRKKAAADIDSLLHRTSDVLEQRRRQIEGLQTRSWIPLLAIGAVLLVLGTAVAAPWVMGQVSGRLLCWLADGFWLDSVQNCGF